MKLRERVLVGIFLFLLLFRPSLVSIDLIYILTGFSAYMLLYEYKGATARTAKHIILKLLSNSYFKAFFALLSLAIIAFIYNVILEGFPDREMLISFVMAIARLSLTFVFLPINLVWLFTYCKKKDVTPDNLLKILYFVIICQLVCVVAAYCIPPVKDFFIWLMQANGNWSERWTQNHAEEFRMFGFAKSLVDTFGFGMGVLSTVPWILAYRLKDLRYLLILPLIFFSVFINARTGIVIMGLATVIFTALFGIKYRHFYDNNGKLQNRNRFAIFLICFSMILVSFAAVTFLKRGGYFAATIWRDIRGYLSYVVSGGDISSVKGTQALTNFSSDFWIVPDDPLQFVIGAAQSVYGSDSIQGSSSDVGYINNVWLFGIVGTVLLHFMVILFLWRYRLKGSYGNSLATFCIVSILLFQIKASALWSANLGVSSIALIYLFGYYEKNETSHDLQDIE